MKRLPWLFMAAFALALIFAACGDDDDDDDDNGGVSGSPVAVDPDQLKLKFALLPIIDILPMFVAEQEGYFKREGLTVELIPFASAVERDAAMISGAVDGEIADLISSTTINKDRIQAKIIRLAYEDQPDRAQIAILASKDSGIERPEQLAGVPIAISSNSLIEYETDVLLRGAGLAANRIEKTEVPQIPVRAQLLAEGKLKAATLPEPAASFVQLAGAKVVIDDRGKDIAASVLTFRTDSLAKKPEGIRRFLKAYESAVEAINSNPSKYEALFIEKANVPQQLKGRFGVPKYPKAAVPSEGRVQRAVAWSVERGLISKPIAYGDLVDKSFLPK